MIREELEKPTSPGAAPPARARACATPRTSSTRRRSASAPGSTAGSRGSSRSTGCSRRASTGGERLYSESDAEIAAICGRLAGFGIAPRHLRTFRTSVDRETGLLEAAIAPALRSRNPERRQQGTRDLQTLGELAQELSQRLFWRGLRGLVS